MPMKSANPKAPSSGRAHGKTVLVLMVGLAAAGPAFGGDQSLKPEDFWKFAGASPAVPALGSLLGIVPAVFPETAGLIPWIICPSQLPAHIPLYWLDPGKSPTLLGRTAGSSRGRRERHVPGDVHAGFGTVAFQFLRRSGIMLRFTLPVGPSR